MDNQEQCKNFIDLLEQKKATVSEDIGVLSVVLQSLLSIFERYYDKDSTLVKTTQNLKSYISVLQKIKKESNPILSPRCNIRDIASDTVAVMDTAIDEVKAIGLPEDDVRMSTKDISITNTLNQSQTQSQEQSFVEQIFIEAIKDELNGKQRKELLSIAQEVNDPKEAHKGILSKLKEFGIDVSASIVANILTNPQIWATIGSLI